MDLGSENYVKMTLCAFCGELRHKTNSRTHYKNCKAFKVIFNEKDTCLKCNTEVTNFVKHVRENHRNSLHEKFVKTMVKGEGIFVAIQPSNLSNDKRKMGRPKGSKNKRSRLSMECHCGKSFALKHYLDQHMKLFCEKSIRSDFIFKHQKKYIVDHFSSNTLFG